MAINPSVEEKFGDVLGIDQVSRYLGIHKMTVYRLIRTEGLPGRMVSNRWRFNKDAVKEWLNKKIDVEAIE
jgi:excisionase family DNA binding protein